MAMNVPGGAKVQLLWPGPEYDPNAQDAHDDPLKYWPAIQVGREGETVGLLVGNTVGAALGENVGNADGKRVGLLVGAKVEGETVGALVGKAVGDAV